MRYYWRVFKKNKCSIKQVVIAYEMQRKVVVNAILGISKLSQGKCSDVCFKNEQRMEKYDANL